MEVSSQKKSTDNFLRVDRIEELMRAEGYEPRRKTKKKTKKGEEKIEGVKNQGDFAVEIGMEPQNFSRCLTSGKVSEKICKKIVAAFPEWRIEYLMGYDDSPTLDAKRETSDYCCWGIFENSLNKKELSLRFNHNQPMKLHQRHYSDYQDRCYHSVVDKDGNEVTRLSAREMIDLEQKLLEYADFLTHKYIQEKQTSKKSEVKKVIRRK